MALTRKYLKAMGIEDDKIEQIIDAHTETVDGLKTQIAQYKTDAEKLAGVQAELDALKEKGDGGYKEKYEAEKKAHDALKADIAEKTTKAAKEAAVKAYYEGKNITGKNLAIAMRGTSLDGIELDGEKIKDTAALDELVKGDFASLVTTTNTTGANTGNPLGNGGKPTTKAEIMAIKDTSARQQAIAENHELFGF